MFCMSVVSSHTLRLLHNRETRGLFRPTTKLQEAGDNSTKSSIVINTLHRMLPDYVIENEIGDVCSNMKDIRSA
jgi:hypothetical protein